MLLIKKAMSEQIYKFDKLTRYLTRGVNEEIPIKVQVTIWSMIDDLVSSDTKVDYLQVFKFQEKHGRFFIHHSQEVPNYQKTHEYDMTDDLSVLLNKVIFVIDDVTHSTILLSSEY